MYNKIKLNTILSSKRRNGFTLIELMIGITLVGTVLLSLLAGYMACLTLNEISRDIMIATEDARRVIEQMRSLSVSTLSDITGINWTTWAVNNGLNALTSEQITVSYTDRDATGTGLDDDPLYVTVTVNWQEKTRARGFSLVALITVR